MADAAVTFLLETAQKVTVEDVNLILGEEAALKALQDELDLMRAFFQESANKQGKGQVLIQLEKQLREKMCETEDTLDACLMQKAKGSTNVELAKKAMELLRVLPPLFQRAFMGLNALPPVVDGSAHSRENYYVLKM